MENQVILTERVHNVIVGNRNVKRTYTEVSLPSKIFARAIEHTDQCVGISLPYYSPILNNLCVEHMYKWNEQQQLEYIIDNFPTVLFSIPLKKTELEELFQVVNMNAKDDVLIYTIILLIMFIVQEREGEDMNDLYSLHKAYEMYLEKRREQLKLYILLNTEENMKSDKVIVSFGKGKGSVKINNIEFWATEGMIRNYLSRSMKGIQSVEQAQEEMERSKPKQGRKPINVRVNIITFGLYKVFVANGYFGPIDCPDILCDFIIEFLLLCGTIKIKDMKTIDRNWIRSQLDHMKHDDLSYITEFHRKSQSRAISKETLQKPII